MTTVPLARAARRAALVILLAHAGVLAPAQARADEPIDTVFLMKGGRLRGSVLLETESLVRIQLVDGTLRDVPRDQVKRIQYGEVAADGDEHPDEGDASPPRLDPVTGVTREPDDGDPDPTGASPSLATGVVGGLAGGLGGGIYPPQKKEKVDKLVGIGSSSIDAWIGYFVSHQVVLGTFLTLQPSVSITEDGAAFSVQGYLAFNLQYHLDPRGTGTFVETSLGFGGGASPDVYGGYGPMLELGVNHVVAPTVASSKVHFLVGGDVITSVATRSGDFVGVYLLGTVHAGLMVF